MQNEPERSRKIIKMDDELNKIQDPDILLETDTPRSAPCGWSGSRHI